MTPEERAIHCRFIAAAGGRATVERHGREHMQEIGRKGFARAMETIGGHALYEILRPAYRAKYGRDPVRNLTSDKYREKQRIRRQACTLHPDPISSQCDAAGELHHIRGLAAGNGPDNIEPLCRDHHLDAHRQIRRAS